MSVLVTHEYSATVRDALRARGIDAYSNDILETDGDPRWHIQGDYRDAIQSRPRWDMIIMHVVCTAMAVCGNKHYARGKPQHGERLDAISGAVRAWELAKKHSDCVVLENPASVIFPVLRKRGADIQYIQPWQHGHLEQKKTGLALYGLPRLTETNNVYDEMMKLPKNERERIFYMTPSDDRGKLRSKFYNGFADAFANQWGDYIQMERAA